VTILHLSKRMPMLLQRTAPARRNAATTAAASVPAALLISSLALSVLAMRRRAARRRQLRYRVASASRRAMQTGLRRSVRGVERVSAILVR